MRKPLCVGSSDWHLEKNAWIRYPDIAGDSYFALQQIVDYCIQYGVPLLAAGDLFDKPFPDSKSVYMATRQMDRMENARLKVFFTQGQHEMSKDEPWLSSHTWPIHTHEIQTKIKGVNLYGLDYIKAHQLKATLELVPATTDILMCHQVWRDFMGSCVVADGSLSQINLSNKLILTGDYHKHVQIKVSHPDSVQDNQVLSPGSMCLQSIDEPPDKLIYLIYDDLSFESLPLKSRLVHKVTINNKDELDQFVDSVSNNEFELQEDVPDNIARPILVLRYASEVEDIHSRLTQSLTDSNCHLFLRPMSQEMAIQVVETTEAQKTIDLGLIGNLSKLCDKESEQFVMISRLLNSSNPSEELNTMYKEFMKGT